MAIYNYSDEEMKDADEILKMLESESPSSPPYMKQDEPIESPVAPADENYEYYDKELYDLNGEKKKPVRKPDSMRPPNMKAERRDFSGIDPDIAEYVLNGSKSQPVDIDKMDKLSSFVESNPRSMKGVSDDERRKILDASADSIQKQSRSSYEIDPEIEKYLMDEKSGKGPEPLDMDKMALEAEKNQPYKDDGKWSNESKIDVIDPDIVAYLANLKSGERIEPYQEKSDSALEAFKNLDPMGRVPATPENPGFNSYEAREKFNSYQKDRADAKSEMEERDRKLAISEAGDLFAYAGQGRAGDIANQYLLKRKMNKDEVYGDLRENRMAREEKLRKVLEARRSGFYPVYENPNAAFDDRSLQDFRYDLNSSQARKERMDYAEKIGQLHGQDAQNAHAKRQQDLLKEYNDALDARGRAKNDADIKEADARIKNAEDRLLLDKDKFGADNADKGLYRDAKGNWQKKALPPGAIKRPKFNEGEYKAAGFAQRMGASNKILNDVIPGFKDNSGQFDLSGGDYASEAIPWPISKITPDSWKNSWRSKEYQKYIQAKNDFITAVLRKESGATISDDEFDREDRKYFPQMNDSQDVVKQKAASRKAAIDSMVYSGGGAFELMPQSSQGVQQSDELSYSGEPKKKKEVRRQENKKTGQIRVTYDDGSSEIIK